MVLKQHELMEKFNYIQSNKPLGKLFETENNKYFYDTGTGKVVQCEDFEQDFLDCMISGVVYDIESKRKSFGLSAKEIMEKLNDVYTYMMQEDLLNVEAERRFYSPAHFENIEKEINTHSKKLILELTERCNLRCTYCTYSDEFHGERNHGQIDMSEDVAFAAIDFLAEHSQENTVMIAFYGGEPLLKFNLIKKCVSYSREKMKGKDIKFMMTTNLTLMTREMAEYFYSVDGFTVVGSIDGDEKINDDYRKDIHGQGTYKKAIKGLRNFVDVCGQDSEKRMILSMVFTPPYSSEKLEKLDAFFKKLHWMPKGMRKVITYPAAGSVPKKMIDMHENTEKVSLDSWGNEKYLRFLLNELESQPFNFDDVEHTLMRIHERKISEKAHFNIQLNGCCVPIKDCMYISPVGDVRICEKILGENPVCNIKDKIDVKRIEDVYLKPYRNASEDTCLGCWSSKLCAQCYATTFKNGLFDMDIRNEYCQQVKEMSVDALKFYYRCNEKYSLFKEHMEFIGNEAEDRSIFASE